MPRDDAEDRLRRLVHDIRTPLAVTRGFADLLVQRGEACTPEQRAQYLARIRDAAVEMDALLDGACAPAEPDGE